MAATLAVAAFVNAGAVYAAVSGSAPSQPTGVISLAGPAPASSNVLPGDTFTQLLLGARIDSMGSLNPVNGFDLFDPGTGAPSVFGGLPGAAAIGNSPYMLLTQGGSYFGSSYTLADDVVAHLGIFGIDPDRLSFGMPGYSYFNQVQSQQALNTLGWSHSGIAAVDWNFASWGALGLTTAQTSELNGALGASGAFTAAPAKAAKSTTVGVTAHVGWGDGWVTTLSYNEGLTQLELRPSALAPVPDTFRSRAYGFSVAKRGLFDENDSLGLTLSRPLEAYPGEMDFTASGFDSGLNDIKLGREFASLTNVTPETDFELGYVTTFMGGAIALQANAGYQMNVAGFGGTNALSVISRAKINF